jgi:hypothetical protein
MVVPEAPLAGRTEVVLHILDAENVAGFLFDSLSTVIPDQLKDMSGPANDVVGVVGIVHKDTVPINAKRVARRRFTEWQAIRPLKHSRGADRQRCERIRQVWRSTFASGESHIPPTEGRADAEG